MTCSENTCCGSSSIHPHRGRQADCTSDNVPRLPGTPVPMFLVASNPAPADLADGEGSPERDLSHLRNFDDGLARFIHSESRGGASHCAHISSKVTSSHPTMTCCNRDTCCVLRLSGELPLRKDPSSSSNSIGLKDASSVTIIDIDKVDVEASSCTVRQVALSISGMTCSGCLKNLDQCLESIPTISNIKTSLLLSQAVFDLRETSSLNKNNIAKVIAKKTGFTCAVVVHVGEELDLILDPNVTNLGVNWPFGVVDITSTGKNRVRISYRPRIIGARDLLSDPFFQHASLAPPSPPASLASARASIRKSLYLTFLSAMITIPVLVFAYADLPNHAVLYGGISCGMASLVQFLIVGPFYTKAFKALIFSRMVEMDMLVVLSTTVAYIYSVIAYAFLIVGKPLSTGEFFETGTLLVTLIMVGRSVAEYARHKAVESISMESLQSPSAIIVQPAKEDREVDARLLQYKDTFKVLPEMSVVTDGIIQEGETEVDESLITGEATLISKKPGMPAIAGSINHAGTIIVKLTRLPSENTIKTISTMVDEAKSSKPKIQEIADRVAGYFVPGILAITAVVFLVWIAVGRSVRHQSPADAAINAMTFAISTLIVSCPCAIGLAVPMVVFIAGGVAARHGLILKSTETIEIGRKISHVIFDKTGTLTQGKLSVVDEEYIDDSEVASTILDMISNSKHPVSAAVAGHLIKKGIKAVPVENITSVPGNGMEGTWNGSAIRAGSPYWLSVQDLPSVNTIISKALTTFCVTLDGKLIAAFGLQDELRPDAIETIDELRKRSIEISLVSGDNDPAVKSLATHLGIPPHNTRSRCTPAEKRAYVESALLVPNSVILFCGDGTNDAVALAQASIGLHLNEGTDVAQSAADAILMRHSLKGILTLIDLSEAFWRRVMFNFAWSFVYNLCAILLAAGAFPGKARIPPQYAGLGELVSVLPVIGIAAGLRWKKF